MGWHVPDLVSTGSLLVRLPCDLRHLHELCQGSEDQALTGPPSLLSLPLEALRFEDRPDYAYLRRLFKELFAKEGAQDMYSRGSGLKMG